MSDKSCAWVQIEKTLPRPKEAAHNGTIGLRKTLVATVQTIDFFKAPF
jgi:hypothetical protein